MTRARAWWPAAGLVLAMALPALALTVSDALALLPAALWWRALATPDLADPAQLLARHAFAPRVLVALCAGGALGLAGAVLQQALRNPLAEPTTIGASAGAGLALAAASLYAPWLLEWSRGAVAFAGSAAAAALALGVAARARFSPVTLILAGLVVSLVAGSATGLMLALSTDYVAELFVWQSGSLVQVGEGPTLTLAAALGLAGLAVAALARPLALIGLGDEAAAGLGLPPWLVRLAALVVALALAAAVAAAVGVIAFVGLAAPALARLCGLRRFGARAAWSVPVGACLLWLTDRVALELPIAADLPAGSLTALMGAPLLFVLLPRREPVPPAAPAPEVAATRPVGLPVLVLGLLAILAAALHLGRAPGGWWWGWSWDWTDLDLRAPRVLAAFAAGSLLGTAGAVLQRLTGNPVAAPEMVGAPAGATIGVLVLLGLTPGTDPAATAAAAVAGALAAVAFVMLVARGTGFRSERWLVAGVALSTLATGLAAVALASGDPRTGWLQAWLSGSTYAAAMPGAVATASVALAALVLALLARR